MKIRSSSRPDVEEFGALARGDLWQTMSVLLFVVS